MAIVAECQTLMATVYNRDYNVGAFTDSAGDHVIEHRLCVISRGEMEPAMWELFEEARWQ